MIWLKIVAALFCLLLPVLPARAAGLFQHGEGPVILLAEVQSYGDYELTPEAFDTLADKLSTAMRKEKLNVVSRREVTNEAGRHGEGTDAEDADISQIHMAAIIRGHYFQYGYASARLKHYADATLGRAYFYDEARTEAWAKNQSAYKLPEDLVQKAQAIAGKYGADYLLFVNNKDVDVRLKGTTFASHTDKDTRGKKMRSQIDYFLLNPKNGLVYGGHFQDKKNAQLINTGLFKTGKGMNVEEMLSSVMEEQCSKIAKDIAKRGVKAVSQP